MKQTLLRWGVAALAMASTWAALPLRMGQAAPAAAGKVVTATDRDNNETINLHVGDTLVVRLVSNPSTNYAWKVGAINQTLLRLAGAPKYEASTSGLLGAPGYQVFTFEARAAGGDELGLLYQNPTLRGVQALHTFRLRVVITGNEPKPAGKTIVVTDADNGESLTVADGDTLVVKLQSNATTGYSWIVVDNVNALLKLEGETYQRGANRPGAGGTQQFTFKVVGRGEVALKMAYQRSWERGVQAAKTWQMFIETPGAKPAPTPKPEPTAQPLPPVTYVCAGGANFTVEFSGTNAKVTYDGETRDLPQQRAADGFDYADGTWDLRGVGNAATLTDLTTNQPVGEPVGDNCTAQASAADSAPTTILTNFTCKDGSVLAATFSGDVASVTYNGQTRTLKQGEAADGALYSDGTWELRTKAAMATLTDLASGNVLGQDCLDLSKTDAGQNPPVTYACADTNTSIVVVFSPKVATVTYNGQTQKLIETASGDGFAYANEVWALRGKDNTITLTDVAANKAVETGCKSS